MKDLIEALERMVKKVEEMTEKVDAEHRRRMEEMSPADRGLYLFNFFIVAYKMRGPMTIRQCKGMAIKAAIVLVGDEPGQSERLAGLFDKAQSMVDKIDMEQQTHVN